MVFGSAPLGASPHSDVLSATPQTVDEKLRLIDELKSRGKASVLGKDWHNADRLYGKGIEVLSTVVADADGEDSDQDRKKDLAILYSNQSLALYQLGRVPQSRTAAERSIEYDPTYVKAYWRLGQCCASLNDWAEAKDAYTKALELDGGNNKALKKEVEKCAVKVEQERLLVMEGRFDGGEEEKKTATTNASTTKPTTKTATSSAAAPSPATAKVSKTTSTSVVKDDAAEPESSSEFTSSDHVRGYKIVDGKKTSYFHHEMTEKEKALIGDIAPKKLDEVSTGGAEHVAKIDLNQRAAEGASTWNKAGTWEERDVTQWAGETLQAALLGARYDDEKKGVTAKIVTATKMSVHEGGHASVAAVRGKKRYIYEFGFELGWELEASSCDGGGEDMSGTMTFPDIDGTCALGEGYDMTEFKVEGGLINSQRAFVGKHVRDGGLRKVVEETIDDWVRLFRATY